MQNFNRLPIRFCALVLIALLFPRYMHAQAPIVTGNPNANFFYAFYSPAFVENKGQYNALLTSKIPGASQDIRFGSKCSNATMLITSTSIAFVSVKREKEEKGKDKGKNEKEERVLEQVEFFLEWVNANPAAKFETQEKSPEYFTFPDPLDRNRTIISNGYKTIICRDIYPGIDLEYRFHPKGGLKYSFIVHPGADASRIKGKWKGVEDLRLHTNGNLLIETENGNFRDVSPETYYEGDPGAKIASAFQVDGKTFWFNIAKADPSKTIIIDPWISNPAFAGANTGYDIAQDAAGDIYVYGGSNPYELKKFTSLGAPIWTFNTSAFGYYGDMCLDNAGNPYCIYGPWGDQCVKLTPGGVLTYNVNSGGAATREIYRIEQNPASGQMSVCGMELPGNLIPMMLSINPATGTYSPSTLHPTNQYGETRGMCVDANGDVYSLVYNTVTSPNPAADNMIWKTSSAYATIISASSGYLLDEVDPSYTDSEFSGFNGMDVGCDLYTFDGVTLMKRDKATLALLGSVVIPGGVEYSTGGVYTDPCGNVYVGGNGNVYMYDNSLTLISTQVVPGMVCDICPGLNPGEILVCGSAFFGSVTFPSNPCSSTVNVTSTPSNGCPCNGTASVTVQQLCSSGAYTYQWLPSGATTSTATNLCPGTHTVIYTDTQSGVSDTATVTVTGSSPSISVTSTSSNPSCAGYTDGSITANPSGGSGPYTYQWLPGNQSTQTISSLPAGTYTVNATDANGCSGTQIITLIDPPGMTVTTAVTPASCSACDGTATVNPIGGGGPTYTFSWTTSPVQVTQTATSLCPGTYSVTITDANGCTTDTSLTIVSTNSLTVSSTAGPPIACYNDCTGSATANPSSGTAPYTYSWNSSPAQATQTATGLCAGTYTCIVTDANGCSDSVTVTLTQPAALNVQTTSPLSMCAGDCGTLAAVVGGGTPGYTLSWNPGPLAGNNVPVCPAATTTYTLTATDANGCTITDSVQANVLPLPSIAFVADTLQGCEPLCVNFTNNTPNTATASWGYGDGTFGTNPSFCYPAGTYDITLVVVDNNGCTDTLTQLAYIQSFALPTAAFSAPTLPVSEWESEICVTDLSSGGPTIWAWDFNDPQDPTGSTAQNPCHTYSEPGIYCIDLRVETANGCWDTTQACVEIYPETSLYIPNAFTPNGGGPNEIFLPVGLGITNDRYSFMVFDRWGMLIYETHTWGEGWDGTFKGNKCQEDVYVWKLSCIDTQSQQHNLIGHVSLIR